MGKIETPISRPQEEQKTPNNSYLSRFFEFFKAKIYAVLGVDRMVGAARIEARQEVKKEFKGYIAPNVYSDAMVQLDATRREIEEVKKEFDRVDIAKKDATAQLKVSQEEAERSRAQLEVAKKEIEKLREATIQAVQKVRAEFKNYVAPNVHQHAIAQLETVEKEIEALRAKRKIPKNDDVKLDRISHRRIYFAKELISHPKKKAGEDFCSAEYLEELEMGLFIVCDGLSGYNGCIGSSKGVSLLRRKLRERLRKGAENPIDILDEVISQVSDQLLELNAGTTLDLALYDINSFKLYTAHAGDSEQFLIKGHAKDSSGKVNPLPFLGAEIKPFTIRQYNRETGGPLKGLGCGVASEWDIRVDDIGEMPEDYVFLLMQTDWIRERDIDKFTLRKAFDRYTQGDDLSSILSTIADFYHCPREYILHKLKTSMTEISISKWKFVMSKLKEAGFNPDDERYENKNEIMQPLLSLENPEHILWVNRFALALDDADGRVFDDYAGIVVDLKGGNVSQKAPRRKCKV